MIFEDYLAQLDIKMDVKKKKILLFINQCSACLKKTTFLRDIKLHFIHLTADQLQPSDFEVIQHSSATIERHVFERPCTKTHAACMKLDVLPTVHLMAQAWRQVSPTTVRKSFGKLFLNTET
jgi:hypothetical protein